MNSKAEKYDPANIVVKDLDFNRMNEQYREKLCRYAEKFVGQKYAKDMVQDAFESLWKKRDSNLIIEKFSPYLHWSVKNNCFDFLKHEMIKHEHSKKVQAMYDNGDRSLIQDDNDPHSILELQESEKVKKKVKKAIDKLPVQQRTILHFWLEGVNYQKIAKKLDISEGTVCKQINRAKTRLRKKLSGKQ